MRPRRWIPLLLSLVAATAAAAPEASPPETLHLYRGWEDLLARRPAATLDAPLLAREGAFGFWGLAGSIPIYRVDLRRREALPLGGVQIVEAGERLLVNFDAPIPARGQEFAPVDVYGDRGLVQHRSCYQVPNGDGSSHTHCDLALVLVALDSGTASPVHRDNLAPMLAGHPDLRDAFLAERRKTTRVVRSYLLQALARDAAVDEDR